VHGDLPAGRHGIFMGKRGYSGDSSAPLRSGQNDSLFFVVVQAIK